MSTEPGACSRTPRRRLHAPEAQAVTFVELFFDLVFVFAVTQVTSLTSVNLTWSGDRAFAAALLAHLVGVDAVHVDAQPG